MSPATARMLIEQVLPRIKSAVPNSVKRVGCEDVDELIQDTAAQAAYALESCENRGVPIYPASVAYYAVQRAKSGRRSYGATRTDAMCPACQLDGNSTLASMDEHLPCDDEDAGATLHDVLSNDTEDPSQIAGRELDWESLLADLDDRELAIVEATANGDKLDRLASRFHISAPRITQIKQAIGKQVKARWGSTVLADIARSPRWSSSLMATWQRELCRHARSKASEW